MTTTWRFESVPIGGAPCYNMLKPQLLDSWQEAGVLPSQFYKPYMIGILCPYPVLEKSEQKRNHWITC